MRWLWSKSDRKATEVLGINRRNLDHVFADYRPGKFRDLDDKLRAKERLTAQGIPVSRTLLVIASPADLGRLDELLRDRDELVIKPARGSRGRGILVLQRSPDGWRTPGGRLLDEDAIHEHAHETLSGHFSLDEAPDQVLIETRIHSSRWIRSLFPGGLSDIRVVVEDGEPLQAMLRVPTSASDGRANLHEGGIGIGIDLETGRTVHAVQDGRVVSRHPDTGEELIGHRIPEFDTCLEVARGVARTFPEISYLGVDLVIDGERGVLVLEVNARPGLAIQIANQQGQPVRRRRSRSQFEIATERAAWIGLALLGIAPFAYGLWRGSVDPVVEPVRVERGTRDEVVEDSEIGDAGGVEWSDSSEPVSARDDRFARALVAVAEGDTTRALALYEEAAADPSVRPFALNNVALIYRARNDLERARDVLELAVESYPSYARGHYNLGLVRRDLGDRDAAMQSFLRTTELRPSHARSWSRLGEFYLDAGEWESAVNAFERAVRFDPDSIADRRRLGIALLALGRPGEAAHRYAEALALSPRSWSSEAGYLRARLAQLASAGGSASGATLDSLDGQYAQAARHHAPEFAAIGAEISWWMGDPRSGLDRIAAVADEDLPHETISLRTLMQLEIGAFGDVLSREPGPDRQRLHDLARWGLYLDHRVRRLEESAPDLTGSVDPVVRVLATLSVGSTVGEELAREARQAAADETERRWIESVVKGANWEHTVTLARIPRAANQHRLPLPTPVLIWARGKITSQSPDESEPELSNFVPHLRERFAAEVDTGSTERAHELGLRLLHNAPRDSDALIALTGLELELGNTGLARVSFDGLSRSGRRRPDARLLEARLLLDEGERRAARRVVDELLRQNPSQVEALEVRAAIQLANRDTDDAIDTLREALLISPGRQDLRERLARALMSRRRYAEAEAEWTRLADLDTDDRLRRSALFNLALSVQRQGRDEEAITNWAQLLIEYPEHTRAHYNLGLAYERSGRTSEAIRQYRRVLELDPDHESSRDRLQTLDPRSPGDS